MSDYGNLILDIEENIGKVVLGKKNEIVNLLKGIIAGGHILIEDVPGVGKTTLVKAIKSTFNLTFSRIQFTPDLLPSDITGVSIYNNSNSEFTFKKGPIFSNIVLADEINRTSPKTQSALLEVMEELQVSEGGVTYKIEKPFFVMATENPIEYEGTFSLPEAQLDRFLIKIKMGYPSKFDEGLILMKYKEENPLDSLKPVANREDILKLQDEVKKVKVHEEIIKYIVNIVDSTRYHSLIALGSSIRGSLGLQRIAQATALMKGRDYVIPEDVKENVKLVLCHRIILKNSAYSKGIKSENILDEILKTVPTPKVI